MTTPRRATPRKYDEHGNVIEKWCNFCKRMLPIDQFNKHATYKDGHAHKCKECFTVYWHANVASKRIQYLVNRIRSKCAKEGIPCDITVDDIVVPERCPVLGIVLEFGKSDGDKWRDNSPSVDRIIPELGYVKGNIIVVSYRANRIKNDATIDELVKISTFYRQLTKELL